MVTRRRFGAARKLPSGRYQARYYDAAGRRHTAANTFARKGDAERWLAGVETDMTRGNWTDPTLGRLTFAQWADDWRRTLVSLRPTTRARDEQYLRTLILPTFGPLRLVDIDHLTVREWVAELSASGRAPATVVKAHQILGKILKSAVASGALGKNPAAGVPLPRAEREEMRFLTPDEVAALAGAMDARYRALVWLGAYGGLRIGELFGLRTDRVHPLQRTVDVAEILVELGGRHYFGSPKTKAGRRVVPVPRFVADHLADHIGDYQLAGDNLVFPSPDGSPARISNWRNRYWLPAVRSAGVEPLRTHDLRHTAIAFWIAAGVSLVGIARRAGHTSVVTVHDRYGHLLPGSEDAADEALDQMARQAKETPPAPVRSLGSSQSRHQSSRRSGPA